MLRKDEAEEQFRYTEDLSALEALAPEDLKLEAAVENVWADFVSDPKNLDDKINWNIDWDRDLDEQDIKFVRSNPVWWQTLRFTLDGKLLMPRLIDNESCRHSSVVMETIMPYKHDDGR